MVTSRKSELYPIQICKPDVTRDELWFSNVILGQEDVWPVYGGDSMTALCLAIQYVKERIDYWTLYGAKLLTSDGYSFDTTKLRTGTRFQTEVQQAQKAVESQSFRQRDSFIAIAQMSLLRVHGKKLLPFCVFIAAPEKNGSQWTTTVAMKSPRLETVYLDDSAENSIESLSAACRTLSCILRTMTLFELDRSEFFMDALFDSR